MSLKDYVAQMRAIPGGTFLPGGEPAAPKHLVTLSAYRMGATPVTVGMWMEYRRATGVKFPDAPDWGWQPNHPMVNVSYEDIAGTDGAGGFCAWASRRAGIALRLPTEAEFEYCARDGGKEIAYPWGNRFDHRRLWCSDTEYGDAKRTAPVDREERIHVNSLGLSDMTGNIIQWCRDWYARYPAGPATGPVGPSTGTVRVIRGGSWGNHGAVQFRSMLRGWNGPLRTSPCIGFRLSAPGK